MLNNFFKNYKIYLSLLLIFFLITDFQSYRILYGEDATWINSFLSGDIYKTLLPRSNFLVLGASLPQLFSLSISKTLSQFAIIKFLTSYFLIFLISISNLLNQFLSKKVRVFLAVCCFLPFSNSVDFEVFGHLHNLVWFYPLLTINLLCFILYKLSSPVIKKKQLNTKLFNLIFIFFSLTSFLFPICAIIVLFSLIFFLIIQTNHFEKKLFVNNKILIIYLIINLILYLINIKDRTGSIADSDIANLSIFKYIEFFIRIFNEPFISLFTHNNYLGSYFLMISALLMICSMNFILFFDTVVVSFKEFLKRKKLVLTLYSVNLFLVFILFSTSLIFSYLRFPELSYFLSGFTNSSYPERYYIFINLINTVVIFTIISNNINMEYLIKSKNNFNFYFGQYSKFAYYKFQKKLFTIILFVLIIISISSRLGSLFFTEVDSSRFIYSSCSEYENKLYVDGFPKEFKTVIPKESLFFKDALKNCIFTKN